MEPKYDALQKPASSPNFQGATFQLNHVKLLEGMVQYIYLHLVDLYGFHVCKGNIYLDLMGM